MTQNWTKETDGGEINGELKQHSTHLVDPMFFSTPVVDQLREFHLD